MTTSHDLETAIRSICRAIEGRLVLTHSSQLVAKAALREIGRAALNCLDGRQPWAIRYHTVFQED